MKFLFRWLAASVVLVTMAGQAQIKVELTFPQEQYLPYERLVAEVRVHNLSGQTLTLGKEANWLTFNLESKEGGLVSRQGEAPVVTEFTVDSSEVGIRRVDLAPYFGLTQQGRYEAVATVKIAAWDKAFSSATAKFDIVGGTRIWEQEAGIPAGPEQTGQDPEVRKYTLLQVNTKNKLRLYYRLSNATGDRVMKVIFLGPMLSIGSPEAQVDKFSNLHVLHQVGAKAFSYIILNPEGRMVVRETHDYTASRPKLARDEEGRLGVRGGARRITADDLPEASPTPVAPAR